MHHVHVCTAQLHLDLYNALLKTCQINLPTIDLTELTSVQNRGVWSRGADKNTCRSSIWSWFGVRVSHHSVIPFILESERCFFIFCRHQKGKITVFLFSCCSGWSTENKKPPPGRWGWAVLGFWWWRGTLGDQYWSLCSLTKSYRYSITNEAASTAAATRCRCTTWACPIKESVRGTRALSSPLILFTVHHRIAF